MPAALVPRPWDFVDPPMTDKVARSMTPGPATQTVSTIPIASAGLAPQASTADVTGPIVGSGGTRPDGAFHTEVRDERRSSVRGNEEDELSDEQQPGAETEGAAAQMTDVMTSPTKRIEDPDTKDN